jgi:hypothetical protein
MERLRTTSGVLVRIDAAERNCPACGAVMNVQKTVVRRGMSLAHGNVLIRRTLRLCVGRCRRRKASSTRRDLELASVFPSRATVGYDVMVRVGLERFMHHRQRDEIRAALAAEGVDLSAAEISVLAARFVAYLVALHFARAPELRAALKTDGGWPLHLDATGEDGRGTLLVVYAGWRRWVLGAWKLSTERAELILPRLNQVAERFGAPCAIMRDLGRAVSEAAATFVAKRKLRIPVLACHLHFLRDIGKDLMRKGHDELRERFRHFKLLPQLRSLARALGRRLGPRLPQAREQLIHWQGLVEQGHRLPEQDAGLAVVRALAQWVLDFSSDGSDQGFPFDVPMLDLYDRCQKAARATDAFLRTPPRDPQVHRACERFRRILQPVDSQVPFEQQASRLRVRRHLFERLRHTLRLNAKPRGTAENAHQHADEAKQLDQIRLAVRKLAARLTRQRPERGPAQDMRAAIDIVLEHLNRHGHALWGHQLRLPGRRMRLVDRTNNVLEGFFHTLKHGERRRSGRKVLTQDLEQMPPGAALAMNLLHDDYVVILCGSLDRLPAAFAELDAHGLGPTRPRPDHVADAELTTASLPTADKKLVRADEMSHRIAAAASSRAPRTSAPDRDRARANRRLTP